MLTKEYNFLPNSGIVTDEIEQFQELRSSPYSRNMEYRNQRIQARLGLTKFDTVALSGPVLMNEQYWKFSGSYDLIFGTTKDLYKYDFGNTRYDYLTPIYNTGTIEVQAGTPTTLRGNGTLWLANVKVGDFVMLQAVGSGYHTGVTFYEVSAVTSDVLITTTTNMPTTAAGASYAIRQVFTGGNTNIWSWTQFIDTAQGNVFVVSNGKDTPRWYNGTNQFQAFSALPTGVTSARYVANFGGSLWLAWTVEGGNNQPVRVRWSATGNFQSWDDLDFEDLDAPGPEFWINGLTVVGTVLWATKDQGAYLVRPVATILEFDFDLSSIFEGTEAAWSIVPFGNDLICWGRDERFHRFNGVRDDAIFEELVPYLKNIDPTNSKYVYGGEKEEYNQIRWLLPYDSALAASPMIVWDWKKDVVEIWEYKLTQWIRSIGSYLNESDLFVDDPAWADLFVDEQDGYWDDRIFLANAPVMLYGGADGFVYKADTGTTDSGTNFDRIFRTKRMDHNLPDRFKRLWKQEFWLDAQTSGTLTAKIKRNDSTGFDADTKSISLIDSTRDVIKKQVTWDKEYENAQISLEATSHYALHGFINYLFSKRKTMN